VITVCTGTALPFTVSVEWQYLCGCNSIQQKIRTVWSHRTLCISTVLCCVITQNVVVLMIDIEHDSIEIPVEVGYPSV
jgi:hypothetical protein